MADADVTVNLRKLPGLTVTVTVLETREFRLRLWLAQHLVGLAARVLGGTSELHAVRLETLRKAFDDMVVAEVQHDGGIPPLLPEQAAFREAVATVLFPEDCVETRRR